MSTNSTRTGVSSPRYRISPDCRRTGRLSARRLATRSSWASTQLSFRRRNAETSSSLALSRLHDLDATWTDSNAGLPSGPGDDHVVIHATVAQLNPMLRYGLHLSDSPSDLASSSTAGFRNGGSTDARIEPQPFVTLIPRLCQERLLYAHTPTDRVAPALSLGACALAGGRPCCVHIPQCRSRWR